MNPTRRIDRIISLLVILVMLLQAIPVSAGNLVKLIPTLTKMTTRIPARTPTKAGAHTQIQTSTNDSYPPPATPCIATPDISQGHTVFIPQVMKPYYDMSYYTATTTDIYGLGLKRGQEYEDLTTTQNGVVILDFGSPFYYGGNYGTMLFDYTTVLYIPQLKVAVMVFSQGFWNGLGTDHESFLTIVAGTNSSGNHITENPGEAWGTMINELQAHIRFTTLSLP